MGDEFDPDRDYAYADRTRRREPGDTTLGLSPHMDSGSYERWVDPAFQRIYGDIFEGDWRRYDPWKATYRTQTREYDSPAVCSMFRTFQGWTALTAQGPTDGTLSVIPTARGHRLFPAAGPAGRRARGRSVRRHPGPGPVRRPGLACRHPWRAWSRSPRWSRATPSGGTRDIIHAVADEHNGSDYAQRHLHRRLPALRQERSLCAQAGRQVPGRRERSGFRGGGLRGRFREGGRRSTT